MAIRNGLRPGQMGVTLIVKDPAAAAEFYRDVFGAEELVRYEQQSGILPEGTVTAVEMRIGNAHLIVERENPRFAQAPRPDWPRSPLSAATTTAFFTLYVDDVDAVVARALAAGASLPNKGPAVEDAHWGDRVGQFIDPAGHFWRVQTAQEEVSYSDLPGRLAQSEENRVSPESN